MGEYAWLNEQQFLDALKCRNRRAEFVDNLFQVINWDNVAERFAAAIKIG